MLMKQVNATPHILVEWIQNDTTTLGNSLAAFYKIKYILIMQTSNPTPRHLSKRNTNLCQYEDLYANIYSCFIHNCQKLENYSTFIQQNTSQ